MGKGAAARTVLMAEQSTLPPLGSQTQPSAVIRSASLADGMQVQLPGAGATRGAAADASSASGRAAPP